MRKRLAVLVCAASFIASSGPLPGQVRARGAAALPEIAIGLNCLRDAVVPAGRRVLVQVRVDSPSESAERPKIALSNPGSTWGQLVTLSVRDSAGKTVAGLSAASAYRTGSRIVLDESVAGVLYWIIESKDKPLAAGRYAVTARLDSTKSSDAASFRGTVVSTPAYLTVKAAGSTFTAEEARVLALADIRTLIYFNRLDAALTQTNKYLEKYPKAPFLLEEKGDILFRLKRTKEAISAYDLALASITPPKAGAEMEPPLILLRKRQEALRLLAAPTP